MIGWDHIICVKKALQKWDQSINEAIKDPKEVNNEGFRSPFAAQVLKH